MRHSYLMLPLLLWCSAAIAADHWTYFADPAGAFTIAVPAEPVEGHTTSPGADGKPIDMHSFAIERGDGALAVVISDLSRVTDNGHLLEDGVASIKASAASGFSDTPIKVDGHAGHVVHFTDQNGVKFENHMFLFGMKLYQVIAVMPPGTKAEELAADQRFLGSIHFLK
jgi:hypothetical protein